MTSFPKERICNLLAGRGLSWSGLVLVGEVGSTMHGIGVGSDDLDYTSIRMESFEELIVGNPKNQSVMIRTQPEGVRSQTGDIDLNVYTLRKFVALALGGNPSILSVLFLPNYDKLTIDIEPLRRFVASKNIGVAYRGYMQQQLERWIGARGQKSVTRPELVAKYGFDTKYAGHAVRLGFQGVEYLTTGVITLPMPEPERTIVVGIRTGRYSEQEALALAFRVEAQLKEACERSTLPDRPAKYSANDWLVAQYNKVL